MNYFGILGYFIQFFICFCLDRFTKMWALHAAQIQDVIVSKNLTFSLSWNRGVSWSFLSNLSGIWHSLLIVTIGIVILFFAGFAVTNYKNKQSIFFEVMVLAGALSNVVDRFLYGAVIDFIEFHIGSFYWPTFNIADSLIVVGIIGIIIKQMCCAYVCKD